MPFPASSMERPPPHDAKRSALAPGPGKAWQYYGKFCRLTRPGILEKKDGIRPRDML